MVTRLQLPDLETASPALAAEYAAARERSGSVMAIVRATGPRVDVLRAFATRVTLQSREAGEAVAALREHLSAWWA